MPALDHCIERCAIRFEQSEGVRGVGAFSLKFVHDFICRTTRARACAMSISAFCRGTLAGEGYTRAVIETCHNRREVIGKRHDSALRFETEKSAHDGGMMDARRRAAKVSD
ncbi:hypothetical protein [Caballeronia sp. LZ035]|uniref:hypothetical protein n=1 Tax=Caballeronia sp. LZ035 TaxID=3038568 RepID=UPI00286354EC|nr:hypothetical protein [Caballeronia sp. LZ035]MDR5763227.1 hypothetical protein [Caballeronia sp. LZ035]